MAVAIWPEPPTVDALLQARLTAGWRPLPTMMQDGPAILGYAACSVLRGVAPQTPDKGFQTP